MYGLKSERKMFYRLITVLEKTLINWHQKGIGHFEY